MTQCPIPLERLADHVPEIEQAHDWDSSQAEYGISQYEWFRDNEDKAQTMLNQWWDNLTTDSQREWIVRYRAEVADQIVRLQSYLDSLDTYL